MHKTIAAFFFSQFSIWVRLPWEINRRVMKWINPFRLAGNSEDNALGWNIVLNFSELPLKLCFSANYSFFWTIFQPWTVSSDVPAVERGLLTKQQMADMNNNI